MGDATHDNVPALVTAHTQMVAGYVTGSSQILWTAADWAQFPNIPHVTIDQGFTGSPVASAVVRDVQAGAWTASAAVNRHGWTPVRPTIYCSLSTLPQVQQAGWQGDIWVADYDNVQSLNFTVPPGMNCVAKQYTDQGGGGAYDLSVVFDPYWPLEAPVSLPVKAIPAPPGKGNSATIVITGANGGMYVATWDEASDKWTERAWPVKV
jgi:hypothetical protein